LDCLWFQWKSKENITDDTNNQITALNVTCSKTLPHNYTTLSHSNVRTQPFGAEIYTLLLFIIIIIHYHFRRRHCHIGLSAPEFSESTVCFFKEMMTAKCPSVHIMYNFNSVKELSVERVAIDGICPMFHEFSKAILRY
jgi:hypothetical protein